MATLLDAAEAAAGYLRSVASGADDGGEEILGQLRAAIADARAAALPVREPPKHRHELKLEVGSNSFRDLVGALHQIAAELRSAGNRTVSGSPSWAGHWQHVVDEKQTIENYNRQLEAFLESKHGNPT